jgi:hypothetical protein
MVDLLIIDWIIRDFILTVKRLILRSIFSLMCLSIRIISLNFSILPIYRLLLVGLILMHQTLITLLVIITSRLTWCCLVIVLKHFTNGLIKGLSSTNL